MLDKIVRPINARNGQAEHTLRSYAETVALPWFKRNWKTSTALTSTDRIKHHILNDLGAHTLSSLSRTNLQAFLDRKGTTLSASTVAHLRFDLRQILRMAVNDGLIERNPAELLHPPKKAVVKRPALTVEQLKLALEKLGVRERLIVALTGTSGLRPGEVQGLQWHDIHDDGLHIERAIYRGHLQTPKTTNSIRTAAISTSIRTDLDEWRTITPHSKPADWIFPSERKHTTMSMAYTLRKTIRPKLKPHGLDWINYQALRRTAVTLLNEHGADPTVVAKQCGHTVDVSINTYNRVAVKRQQEAIDNLNNIITMPTRKAS